MRVRSAALAALAGALALPAAASAAAPANDAPAGALGFSTVTDENGTPTARQGIAQLGEATADAGIAPCLGGGSFARTVWFRVPAATAPRLVEVTGTGGSGDNAQVPDLAAYVLPADASPSEPQDCDGAEVTARPADVDDAPEVAVRVPAGRSVLVQVGRQASQSLGRVVLSETELILPATPAPEGDRAADAPVVPLGTLARVGLGGATLTEEDPAQPACPASGTAWRRFVAVGTGTQQIRLAGADAVAVTAFVGDAPTADDAVACALRATTAGELALDVPAAAGQTVWVRVGTESDAADAAATLAVGGPGAPLPGGAVPLPGTPGAPGTSGQAPGTPGSSPATRTPRLFANLVGRRRVVHLTALDGSVRDVRLELQRRIRGRYRTIATASRSTLTSGRRATVRLKRTGSLTTAGRYRFVVTARTATTPALDLRSTRNRVLKRLR